MRCSSLCQFRYRFDYQRELSKAERYSAAEKVMMVAAQR